MSSQFREFKSFKQKKKKKNVVYLKDEANELAPEIHLNSKA